MAVITDVEVQTGDEQVVGRLFHVMLLKVLADAACIQGASEWLGPGLLGSRSRWCDLEYTEICSAGTSTSSRENREADSNAMETSYVYTP